MPDREESTASAPPPHIAAAEWEAFEGFRETFLLHFSEPKANAVLRGLGSLLVEMAFEQADRWPAHPEGVTQSELRAALADLRHLEGFLSSVGKERALCSLDASDTALSALADWAAQGVRRIADRIEAELDGSVPPR